MLLVQMLFSVFAEKDRLSSHAAATASGAGAEPLQSHWPPEVFPRSQSLTRQCSKGHLGYRGSLRGANRRMSLEGQGSSALDQFDSGAALLEHRSQSASAELGGVVIGVIPDSEIPEEDSSSQVQAPVILCVHA